MIVLQACGGRNESEETTENELPVIPVEVSDVSRGNISAYYSNTPTLESEQEATVVSKVCSIIEELHVEEGDRDEAGQVIAKIADDQYHRLRLIVPKLLSTDFTVSSSVIKSFLRKS